MPRTLLYVAVFVAGLAAVCGIAIGYVGSNVLAFAVSLLIGACYVTGAMELYRYRQTTLALVHALDGLNVAPKNLFVWLDVLPPTVRQAVRARIEGERGALPGPSLTPYLVGLLVLLGMLGTLLGMVVTLHGTGAALESATDISTIRSSLAAPVTGLSFAFGTSIAGVASSAMLGLLSTLVRRERLDAAHLLDTKIATILRAFTGMHRREESFRLMQRQADLMPRLAERLDTLMNAIEAHSLAANERQIANQQAFHENTETAYRRLAASVEQTLRQSVTESARASSAALQPIMQATMDGIAQETRNLQGSVHDAVRQQLDGHREANEAQATAIGATFDRFAQTVEARATGLVDGVAAQMTTLNEGLNASAAKQEATHAALVARMDASMERFAQGFDARSSSLVDGVTAQTKSLHEGLETSVAKMADHWTRSFEAQTHTNEATAERMAQHFDERSTHLIEQVSARLDTTQSNLADAWRDALAQQTHANEALAAKNEHALTTASASFEAHAASLLSSLDRSHADLRAQLAANGDARLAAWTESLGTLAATLRDEWQAASAIAANHQHALSETLARTANEVSDSTRAHATATIAQIETLVQRASEAPKAAAEVIAELRQKLSDSMVRDTAMLDERARLLATLETLLDAVNHASTEQRTAVDSLVSTSAELLERVGTQFETTVDAHTHKLDGMTAQVSSSAIEVASLSDAFGGAVQAFGTSNETLVAQLQRIEAALDKSLTRSDEQLAYYVAQAREVIDLSMMSQKQIVEDLQHLAAQRAGAGARAA